MKPKHRDLRIKKGAPAGDGSPQRRPLFSPWWDGVLAALSSREGLRGTVVSVDELVALIRGLPGADSKRIRNMGAVRRLAPMLELVARGPNGSRSNGARYRIIEPQKLVEDEFLNEEWLTAAADRMGGRMKKQ